MAPRLLASFRPSFARASRFFVFVLGLAPLSALAGCVDSYERPRVVAAGASNHSLVIECTSTLADCFERAAQVCPDGYRVESASAPVHGEHAWHPTRGAGVAVVSCDVDRDERRTLASCERAWNERRGVAHWWATRSGRAPRVDVPEDAFFHVCEGLPPDAARCMDNRYRFRHADACEEAMGDLDARDVALLDLSLVAP